MYLKPTVQESLPVDWGIARMAAPSSALQSIEVYTKGTKAWFEDKLEAWISATCISNTIDGNKVTIVFEGDNDQKV